MRFLFIGVLLITACSHGPKSPSYGEAYDVSSLNEDIKKGKPTFDLYIYHIQNPKMPWVDILEQLKLAKRIFRKSGVEINILGAKKVRVPESWLDIGSEEHSKAPGQGFEKMGIYARMNWTADHLSKKQERLFQSVIEASDNNDRTVYILTPRSAQIRVYEQEPESKTWQSKEYPTSAISFPPYLFADRIPKRVRGVITLQKRSTNVLWQKTVAHELGHKVMNVSHEHLKVCPQNEIRSDKGLMLYGKGLEIAKGKRGRWHYERLHLSPFLYRVKNGKKIWNSDFKAGGRYDDPLYGKYVVRSACTL